MKERRFFRKVLLPRPWTTLLLVLLVVLAGCQAKEPPLSPAAAAFKKEVKDCIKQMTHGLIAPVAKADIKAITEALKKSEPEAMKLCRFCPFRIGVLDKNGRTLTVYPFKADSVGDFSNYEVVVQTLKSQKIAQQRFYLQDGSQIYIVCIPLLQGKDLVGILALSLSAEEAQKRWGLTEQEFMVIDFNR